MGITDDRVQSSWKIMMSPVAFCMIVLSALFAGCDNRPQDVGDVANEIVAAYNSRDFQKVAKYMSEPLRRRTAGWDSADVARQEIEKQYKSIEKTYGPCQTVNRNPIPAKNGNYFFFEIYRQCRNDSGSTPKGLYFSRAPDGSWQYDYHETIDVKRK